jgi:tetratricopeptide (TPR) repeat protein
MSASSQRLETTGSDSATSSQPQLSAVDVGKLLQEGHQLCIGRGAQNDMHVPPLVIDARASYKSYLHAKDDYASGDYQKALNDIDNAIAHNSGSAMNYFERGLIEERLGNFPQAGEDYIKSTVNSTRTATSWKDLQHPLNNLSESLTAMGDFPLALKVADAAVKADPTSRAEYDTRAFDRAMLGDYDGARDDVTSYLRAATKNPNMDIPTFLSQGDHRDIGGQGAYHMAFIMKRLADESSGIAAQAYNAWSRQFVRIANDKGYAPEQWEQNLVHRAVTLKSEY